MCQMKSVSKTSHHDVPFPQDVKSRILARCWAYLVQLQCIVSFREWWREGHIGGGRGRGGEREGEGGADGAGEQDGSDPDNLLTITVQVQP